MVTLLVRSAGLERAASIASVIIPRRSKPSPELHSRLPQMMVQMLVHPRRLILRRYSRPKKLCGCVVYPSGPAAANRSINPHNRSRSLPRSRSSCTTRSFTVGEFRRIGSSLLNAIGFTIRPMIRPINIRGGHISPIAISIAAEQCASACAGFILPHIRSLSGLSCAIRSFTSSTFLASKRFFIRKDLPRVNPSQSSASEHPVVKQKSVPSSSSPFLWSSSVPVLLSGRSNPCHQTVPASFDLSIVRNLPHRSARELQQSGHPLC
jgi:hypothetical protein